MVENRQLTHVHSTGSVRTDRLLCGVIALLTPVLLLPVIRPEAFLDRGPILGLRLLGCGLALLLPFSAAACLWFLWLPGGGRERGIALASVLIIGLWCVDMHYSSVDLANYFGSGYVDNVDLQRQWHAKALRLHPAAIPHSYRILPDCLLAWLQLLTGTYFAAAVILRITCYWLLLGLIYAASRKWWDARSALVSLVLFPLVYVPSIRYYAGQLTDPVSHLLFMLSIWFLISRRFWMFLPSVVIGVLAKESILVMPIYAAIAPGLSATTRLKWMSPLILGAAAAVAIRWKVSQNPEFESISGLTPDHYKSNLADVWHWSRQTWQTLGWPWLATVLAWRSQPRELLGLAVFLTVCLWTSNLFFSHLMEARNFVPAAIPLILMASNSLSRACSSGRPG